MRRFALVVALVVLAVPATAPAKGSGSGHKNAAKYCKALRAEMGGDAFRTAFGSRIGKNAQGRCVSSQRKARKAARKRARKACKAKGLRSRAMKRCVRNELAGAPAPKPADYEEAVADCQEGQAEDPEEFAAKFGSGSEGFAKCVAHEVAEDADEVEEPGDDKGEDEELEPEDPELPDEPEDEPEPDEL